MEKRTMETIRREIQSLIEDYNGGKYSDNPLSGEQLEKMKASIDEKIAEYNKQSMLNAMVECRDSDDPLMTAIKKFEYQIVVAKTEKSEFSNSLTLKLADGTKPIDLLSLHTFCEGNTGVDRNWVYMVEKLNFLLTAKLAKDLGIDPVEINASYLMNKISREMAFGKNPVSNNNIVKTLQNIISAMIGDGYKATSHDVRFINAVYSKKSKQALSVSCANHKRFTAIISEVCYKLVNGLDYSVDYKKIK